MRDRRAQMTEEMVFWIFYTVMTAIMIGFVVYSPSMVFSRETDTHSLENAIFAERVYDKAGWQSPVTLRVYPGMLQSAADWNTKRVTQAFSTSGSPRRLAMKLTLDGKDAYFDEANYKEWQPLTPVRYKRFVETRPVWIRDQQKLVPLTIDQVYAPVPPGGPK